MAKQFDSLSISSNEMMNLVLTGSCKCFCCTNIKSHKANGHYYKSSQKDFISKALLAWLALLMIGLVQTLPPVIRIGKLNDYLITQFLIFLPPH